MTDRNVIAAQRLQEAQEDANEEACYDAARKAGVANKESAEMCDDGACCCPECPWQTTARHWRRNNGATSLVKLVLRPATW